MTETNERLAVVETKVTTLDAKVDKLDSKVETLSSAYFEDRGRNRGRGDLGVWVRSVLPLIMAAAAAAVSLFGILTR